MKVDEALNILLGHVCTMDSEIRHSGEVLRDEIEQLRTALGECADRLERCCQYGGSDDDIAAEAVKPYRELLLNGDGDG